MRRRLKENEEEGKEPANQKQLADRLRIDRGHLNRAIQPQSHKDWRPVDYILIAVSDELGLPYPFLIPETEQVALELAKQHRFHRRDVEATKIKAGVAENTAVSQTLPVTSEHGSRSKTEPNRSSGRSRATARSRGEPRAR